MKMIGITGSIATGKSAAASILSEAGYPVIDADELSHNVTDSEVYVTKIAAAFPDDDIVSGGRIDRRKLGAAVFSDEAKKLVLEGIVHPAVMEMYESERQRLEDDGTLLAFFECPLLIDKKLMHTVDGIVLVYATREKQLRRLMERNQLTQEEALARINAGMPIEKKVPFADYIIYNDASLEEFKTGVLAFLQEVLKDAGISVR